MRVTGSATAEIQATPERCREALLDLVTYTAWYPGVTSAELVDSAGPEPVGRLVFTTGVPILAEIECVLRIEQPTPEHVRAVTLSDGLQIDGDGWRLVGSASGTTTVTYSIGVEMSIPGGALVEHLVKAKAAEFLIERPVTALKAHLEGDAAH